MAKDEDDRSREEDPFRDLDRFFGRQEEARPPAAERDTPTPQDDVRSDSRDPEPVTEENEADEDLLPPGWLPESLGGTPDRDSPAAGGAGGPELTVDALTKPPAEYEDLPAADEEPPREELRAWEEPVTAVPLEPEDPDLPDLAEVEAAADEMAEDLRSATGDGDLLSDLLTPSEAPTVGQEEELVGPSWEEPTGGQALVAEPVAPPADRNIPMALLTAAVLAVAGLTALAISPAVFAVIVGAIALFGQLELYAVLHRRGQQPATALGLVIGAMLMTAAYIRGESAMVFFVVLALALSSLWYMSAAPRARDGALANIAATILGIVYAPLFASYLLLIVKQPSGRALALGVLGLTFAYDAAAFFVGSVWGTRPLAPTISPKKTWQGLLAATVTTFALAIAILPSIRPVFTLPSSVAFGLVIAVCAPLGDLMESFMKRDLGVKDMGSILPGHGGVLDRIDSVLLVCPAAFYFLRLIS
ncbi:MAG: phosphatidate cytidylyltransferase [Actinomycetota bacterium]|nr:phosphatidate cytidylyltransferase [Actinomycetota bacterium]